MKNGFLRVATVAPKVNVADCDFNIDNIIEECESLNVQNVKVAVFPEMSVTGYTCADLFHSSTLIEASYQALIKLAEASRRWNMLVFVGAPIKHNNRLYNCAVAIGRGVIYGAVPKSYLPEYNEFYEKRWWSSGIGIYELIAISDMYVPMSDRLLFKVGGATIAAEICEDLWAPIPPSSRLSLAGAQIIVNLSASNDLIGKYDYLRGLVSQQSARCISAYLYAGAGYGESSTDAVFDGKAIIAENGIVLSESSRWSRSAKMVIADIDVDALDRDRMHVGTFSDCAQSALTDNYDEIVVELVDSDDDTLLRHINPLPFVPEIADDGRNEEVVNIQVAGLARRLEFTHTKSLVIGISGGLDSTLALLVAVRAFDSLGLARKGITAVTMPGFGTTDRTYNNALALMSTLGVTQREISIVPAVKQHFKDISHDETKHDVTYENSQARERTQILMDIANQVGGMVLGTGDLSELALGWATYNGDHMSMYGVNSGVPKTLVKHLVKWLASHSTNREEQEILNDITETPISPELIPADDKGNIKQKTEDLVGPYELHDFCLYYVLRYGYSPRKIYYLAKNAFDGMYSTEEIKYWMKIFFRRFFNQQFKRSCLPDGPKVGSVCLSPRGDWRMPSDASSALWLRECENLD